MTEIAATATISGLPTIEALPRVWPHISAWAAETCKHSAGCYEAVDIYRAIMMNEMRLWLAHPVGASIAFEPPIAFAVSRVLRYPRKWFLDVPFIGGEEGRMDEWFRPLFDVLIAFSHASGCQGRLSGGGRKGWLRKAGFREAGVWAVYEENLSDV